MRETVEAAEALGSGIGGVTSLVEIAGKPVFVKQVPLTDVERRPENVRSSANLFELPPYLHYGVGSPGFSAWRELAAAELTTRWVLDGTVPCFPLLYGWAVLEGRAAPGQVTGIPDHDDAVAYWHGSMAVRHRLDGLAGSTASLVMFFEHLPLALPAWLTAQVTEGGERAAAAIAMVERSVRMDLPRVAARGLLHFDSHMGNILTDGDRLYFADLGLATSEAFDLDAKEREFVDRHRSHDVAYTMTVFVNWLVQTYAGPTGPAQRNRIITRWAQGDETPEVPRAAADVIRRNAPVAVVINDFYWKLHGERRTVDYPAEDIEPACAAAGLEWNVADGMCG